MLERAVLPNKHTVTLESNFSPQNSRICYQTLHKGLNLILEFAQPQPRDFPATYADLEYALRELILEPVLKDTPRYFKANAHKVRLGGMGAQFATIVLMPRTHAGHGVESGGGNVTTALVDGLASGQCMTDSTT